MARPPGWTRRAALAAPAMMSASAPKAEARAGVSIPGAWQRDIVSETGLAYRVFLWAPPGPPPATGHPVVYLLDGNAVFGTAVDIARLAAQGFGPRPSKPAAIVAIGYPVETPFDLTRRTLDLTPPGGGADAFLDVVERVVKPLVARELPADTGRESLFGHSFGGLFALHCLFTRPTAFATYVAASPSIWWNDRAIFVGERAFAARAGADGPRRLLLSAGSLERAPPGPVPADPHARRLREARMVDNARDMAARLSGTPDLSVRFDIFEGETHGSVIPAALARGLRFAAEQP